MLQLLLDALLVGRPEHVPLALFVLHALVILLVEQFSLLGLPMECKGFIFKLLDEALEVVVLDGLQVEGVCWG